MEKDILYPLRWLHGQMYEAKLRWLTKQKYRNQFLEMRKKNPRAVFLILTPEHTNLGDHAIASEEAKILRSLGVDYIEITGEQLKTMQNKNVLEVMNKTPILINGGGNMGTLWFAVEQLMRDVVTANPKSPIFILPNTIFYEESDYGKAELCKSQKIYNKHKYLTIYARENASHDLMQAIYNRVKLVPDIVLLRNECMGNAERSGCLLCMRNDVERTITAEEYAAVEDQMQQLFGGRVTITDTHADHNVPIALREEKLAKKFDEFRSAELVITDRLHGMIFCAITGTPCVVIDSKSPKVRGCYQWIKHLDYIRFADSPEDITAQYELIPKKRHCYDNSQLLPYYQILIEDIQNIWR